MLNCVVLNGRITKDPTVKVSQDGSLSCSFILAVDLGIKDPGGDKHIDYIPCIAFKNDAQYLCRYVKKGYMIGVQGRLRITRWQISEEAEMRFKTDVICTRVWSLQTRTAATDEVEHVILDTSEEEVKNVFAPGFRFDDDLPF